ncbi:MAG: M1 family metallopeptidase [Bacteroidota bacterium]
MKKIAFLLLVLITSSVAYAQEWDKKFEQLGTSLPTPNTYRTASGAPGPEYWQQKADYNISVELNDKNQSITGEETITYTNNSPNVLEYLWVQLDQNVRAKDSNTPLIRTSSMSKSITGKDLQSMANAYDYDGGFKIASVTDASGKGLTYMINKTMMRIEPGKSLGTGDSFTFKIKWSYNINDRMKIGGRSGYEYFPKDENYLYTIAQWFPRMAVYDDVEGWQNKQFLGRGEFALTFGDYKVNITVPSDFVVASTGTLQNPKDVLTSAQMKRFEKAKKTFDKPVIIVTEEEAIAKEKKRAKDKKTWVFHADNVRDFAFAGSRKLIWDAMAVDLNGKKPLAMSYYPKEGNPLWEEYSTPVVAQTLKTYSRMTIDYPYPVAISVHAASIGMEYPMICFNFGRPNEDGTYSDRKKYGMMSVIIHEVGHNFFPMIINSDERQWTWMDEGLNTFVQYITEKDWDPNYPSRRGPAANIVPYMKGDKEGIRPIMTNSEQILQFGNNAYAKPATALNILRETVMGPELFDYAFKTYATRWAFKHPSPADFFRSMEDASAVDLDWFWKGWFYTTDNVNMSVENVKWYRMASDEKGVEKKMSGSNKVIEGQASEEMMTFSESAESFTMTNSSAFQFGEYKSRIDDNAVRGSLQDKNFYELTLKNKGGLVMPVIIEWTYEDGTKEVERIPAEIWRQNEQEVTRVFVKDKRVTNIVLDPNKETADTDVSDNIFPRKKVDSKFDQFKKSK